MKKNVGRSVQLPRIELNLLLHTDASQVTVFRLPKPRPPSVDGSLEYFCHFLSFLVLFPIFSRQFVQLELQHLP